MEITIVFIITCLVLALRMEGKPMKAKMILDNSANQLLPQNSEILLITPDQLKQEVSGSADDSSDISQSAELPVLVPVELNSKLELHPDEKLIEKHVPAKKVETENQLQDSDEVLVTANNIVFRPLFAYRKSSAQRRRVYSRPSYERSYGYYYYPSYPRYYY